MNHQAGAAAPAVVVSLAPTVEDRLLPAIVDGGWIIAARPAGAAETAETLRAGAADAVLVSATPRYLDASVVAAAAGRPVLALADTDEEVAYGRSLGGGVAVLPSDASFAALGSALSEATAGPQQGVPSPPRPATANRSDPRGSIIAVWGPSGAPGRTTIAISIAAELAATGARVALVDADTTGAAIAPSLGLVDEAPGLAAACRLAGAGALTTEELTRVAQPYRGRSGGFAVLTGIGRPSRWPELSMDRVTAVLETCRTWAEHTVVDAGYNLEADEEIVSDLFAPRRNAATIASLRSADRIVAVGAGDPIGLARLVRGWGDLVETAATDRVDVLVTKVRRSAIGLNPGGQIRTSLSRFAALDDVVLIPDDPAACDAALLTARPLPEAAPRSPAAMAVRRFVAERLTVRPRPARTRRSSRLATA